MAKVVELPTAEIFVPARPTLTSLRKAADNCTACDLYKRSTQTVFGEGKSHAKVLFAGEQPGNDEDLTGKPFVGPAGKLLDRALEAVGIDRSQTYVTNVVKHFKWVPRGKKRIHDKPNSAEIRACLPWLEWELKMVKPEILVCLGATAAQAIFGKQFRVTQHRGEFLQTPLAPRALATVHPSSILRARDDASRRLEMKMFIDDLKKIVPFI